MGYSLMGVRRVERNPSVTVSPTRLIRQRKHVSITSRPACRSSRLSALDGLSSRAPHHPLHFIPSFDGVPGRRRNRPVVWMSPPLAPLRGQRHHRFGFFFNRKMHGIGDQTGHLPRVGIHPSGNHLVSLTCSDFDPNYLNFNKLRFSFRPSQQGAISTRRRGTAAVVLPMHFRASQPLWHLRID